MSQDVAVGLGGEVDTEFLGGRPASCLVSIVDSDGTVRVASIAATVDPVNTTLSVASVVGASSVTLASVAGITTDGRRYLLDGEECTVKSIAGLVVTLWAPLIYAHAIGAVFSCPRVTYTIAAGVCSEEWWDGRAIFVPITGQRQTEAVNCANDPIPNYLFGLTDIRKINPKIGTSVALELDLPASIRLARDKVVMALGTKTRASNHIGLRDLRIIGGHQWICDRRPEYGAEWAAEIDHSDGELARLLAMYTGQAPRADGDGGVIPGPGGAVFPDINMRAL